MNEFIIDIKNLYKCKEKRVMIREETKDFPQCIVARYRTSWDQITNDGLALHIRSLHGRSFAGRASN